MTPHRHRESHAMGWVVIGTCFLALGLALGVVLMLMFNSVYWLVEFIWMHGWQRFASPVYPIVVSSACGIVLACIIGRYGPSKPAPLIQKEPRKPSGRPLAIRLVEYFVPFAAGAPVGVAMGIFQLLGQGCAWIKRHMMHAAARRDLLTSNQDFSKVQKACLYALGIAGAVCGIAATVATTGIAVIVPRLPDARFSAEGIVPTVLMAMLGWALGLVFLATSQGARTLWSRSGRTRRFYPIVLAICLAVCMLVLPHAAFPGTDKISFGLLSEYQATSSTILIATALVRTVLVAAFLNLGWTGGPLFPLVYCALCLGFGMAGAAGIDASLCATAALCGIIVSFSGKPIMALFAFLCCPPESALTILIATIVAWAIPHPRRLQGILVHDKAMSANQDTDGSNMRWIGA